MDSKNLTIGVLSVTSVILFVGLLVIHSMPQPALGAGMTASGGDYTMTVGEINQTEELLYVVNSSTARMIIYGFNTATKKIEIIQPVDLNDMRQAAGAGQNPPGQVPGRGRGRGRP